MGDTNLFEVSGTSCTAKPVVGWLSTEIWTFLPTFKLTVLTTKCSPWYDEREALWIQVCGPNIIWEMFQTYFRQSEEAGASQITYNAHHLLPIARLWSTCFVIKCKVNLNRWMFLIIQRESYGLVWGLYDHVANKVCLQKWMNISSSQHPEVDSQLLSFITSSSRSRLPSCLTPNEFLTGLAHLQSHFFNMNLSRLSFLRGHSFWNEGQPLQRQ